MNQLQKTIIEAYVRAYNQFDVMGMIAHLHPAIEFQNVSGEQVNLTTNGIEEFKTQAESAKTYFEEREQTIQSWDFQGPLVKVQIHYRGILTVDFPTGLKAGSTLELEGSSEFEFEGDKIIKLIDRS